MRFLNTSFLILAFFAAIVVCSNKSSQSDENSSEEKPTCVTNEIFSCKEEVTCDNRLTVDRISILKTCKCNCRAGFARHNGACVAEHKCNSNRILRSTSSCDDPNEQYVYCGSKCPARCGDKPGSRVCTTECVRGCFCKKGFVLNTKNKCVKPEKC